MLDLSSDFAAIQAQVDAEIATVTAGKNEVIADLLAKLTAFQQQAPFVVGRDQPTATTIGPAAELPDGNDPTTDKWILPDGFTRDGETLYGDLWTPDDQQRDIILKDCRLVGGTTYTTTGDGAIVNASRPRGGKGRIILENCEVVARVPSPGRNGIRGNRIEAYQTHVHGVVDGIQLFPPSDGTATQARIGGCLVEDLTAFSPDVVNKRTWTHNDGIALNGGTDIRIWGTFVDCTARALTGTPTGGLAAGFGGQGILVEATRVPFDASVVVEGNWVRGAKQQVMAKAGSVFVYRRNQHYRSTYQTKGWAGYWFRAQDRTVNAIGLDENVWADGPYAGQPLTEPRDRGIHFG